MSTNPNAVANAATCGRSRPHDRPISVTKMTKPVRLAVLNSNESELSDFDFLPDIPQHMSVHKNENNAVKGDRQGTAEDILPAAAEQ